MTKINPTPIRLAQNILTGLIILFNIAILGTSAHTLSVFNQQQSSNPWWMPLWPQHFTTHGTKALIASSTITLVLCTAFFFTTTFLPQLALGQKHTSRFLLALATFFPCLLLAFAATLYAHRLNTHAPDLDTIQTWTCKYKAWKPQHNSNNNNNNAAAAAAAASDMSNADFAGLCRESRFALWGTLIVFLLLCGGLGVAGVAWAADKVVERRRRKEELEMGGRVEG